MDRLEELAVLATVLDAGSLAGAARRLRRSGPAVTRALAALEARAGARLIERTTRRLAPTEAGRQLAAEARALLAGYEAALRGAAAEEGALRGRLRITAPAVFGRRHVVPIVGSFLAVHPGLTAEVMLADRNLDLLEEGLDAAIRIGPLADASALMARRVGEVWRVLVASPAYIARRGEPGSGRELRRHDIVFTAARGGPLEWRLREGGRMRSVRLTPRVIIDDVEGALEAARAGHGIASALSYQVVEDLRSGALVRLLRGREPAPLPVHVVTSNDRHRPRRVRAFVEHAAEALRVLLAGMGLGG